MKTRNLPFGTFLSLAILFLLSTGTVTAQQVSGIITDYNGFWKTGVGYKSKIKPQNSHNLLAFTFNGMQYSTGVNDALLSEQGELFYAADFKALPVSKIANPANSNTKVGLGQLYDGVDKGKSNPSPSNDVVKYLTDGIKGLDIGTGIANIPSGTIDFAIESFSPDAVGDGIPDILITQIADPSNSMDQYEFLDENGNRVGKRIAINLQQINSVGTWTADFYEANTKPMVLSAGFTNTDRELRLWTADFSFFEIAASDISKIKSFRVILSGSSDLAFVAYNNKTMQIGLPVVFGKLQSASSNGSVKLNWNMLDQSDVKEFIIEESANGTDFRKAGQLASLNMNKKYQYNLKMPSQGKWYYRIKVVSVNGSVVVSPVVMEEYASTASFTIFPNPAQSYVQLTLNKNDKTASVLEIRSASGQLVKNMQFAAHETRASINVAGFPKGMYSFTLVRNGNRISQMIVVK